ncbi:MAG TPA: hypothetical protein VF168_04625 [Trueperaceae bacterium]
MTPRTVEQVFLENKGGGINVLLVLEDEAGGRSRERLPLSARDLESAVRQSARHLAQRGVRPARRVRLRVAGGGELRDDSELLRLFLDELTH